MTIEIPVGNESVSGLLLRPAGAKALYLFGHGAGAGMFHPAMVSNAEALADLGVATLRYQFLYMEQGRRRVDPPQAAHAVVRAAAAAAQTIAPDLPLFAGGRSFGGRMTSQAQAQSPLPRVQGLAFLGFPLHPLNKPSIARAEHLKQANLPMIFVSGTRDSLARLDLLSAVVEGLGEQSCLHVVEHADHGFKVPKSSGTTSAAAEEEALRALSDWMLARL